MESVVDRLPDGIKSTKAIVVVEDGAAPPPEQRRRSLMELPPELQSEILVRMPVTSILLCKCVCKVFRNLIQNPNFIQTHLTRVTISNQKQSLILHLSPYFQNDHVILSIDNITKDVLSYLPITPPIPIVGKLDQKLNIIGSCNGLICVLFTYNNFSNDYIFLLWNPVIKQCRYLPKPLCTGDPDVVEFGFVPETNDYLIVKVTLDPGIYVEVYKMSIDSWIVIDCNMFGGADFISYIDQKQNSVYFNGSFHWTCQAYACNYILYYKLKDEGLSLMKALGDDIVLIPINRLDHVRYHNERKLMVIDESLAAIYWNSNLRNIFEVWIMNEYGVEDSWDMRYKIVNDVDTYIYPVGYWTSGNLMIIDEAEACHLYDLNTGKRKKILEMEPDWTMMDVFCSFVETLVLVR